MLDAIADRDLENIVRKRMNDNKTPIEVDINDL